MKSERAEMKKLSTVIIVVSLLLLTGCTPLRQVAIDTSIENVKNAETVREISLNCISVWPIQSGLIKGALGNRINEIPNESVQAIKELDRIAALPEQTDYELGLFIGLKVRLLGSVVQITLEKYTPSVAEILPTAFLLQ